MNTCPLVWGIRPATIRSSVVLPQPLGPSTETKLNSGKATLIDLSASTPGDHSRVNSFALACRKRLLTLSTRIFARGVAGSRARPGVVFKRCPDVLAVGRQTAALLSEVSRMAA